MNTIKIVRKKYVEHETTGFTPNSLMFGREVAKSLNITYDMSKVEVLQHKWAWELTARMKEAHGVVR